MSRDERVAGMRRAVLEYWRHRLEWLLDQGDYDAILEAFLDGQTLNIALELSMTANDILMFNALLGTTPPQSALEAVKDAWKRERNNPGKELHRLRA